MGMPSQDREFGEGWLGGAVGLRERGLCGRGVFFLDKALSNSCYDIRAKSIEDEWYVM